MEKLKEIYNKYSKLLITAFKEFNKREINAVKEFIKKKIVRRICLSISILLLIIMTIGYSVHNSNFYYPGSGFFHFIAILFNPLYNLSSLQLIIFLLIFILFSFSLFLINIKNYQIKERKIFWLSLILTLLFVISFLNYEGIYSVKHASVSVSPYKIVDSQIELTETITKTTSYFGSIDYVRVTAYSPFVNDSDFNISVSTTPDFANPIPVKLLYYAPDPTQTVPLGSFNSNNPSYVFYVRIPYSLLRDLNTAEWDFMYFFSCPVLLYPEMTTKDWGLLLLFSISFFMFIHKILDTFLRNNLS